MLDERRSVARVLLLLLDGFLFLRCVLRLFLARFRWLMGHGSLRCIAEAAACGDYRPKCRHAPVALTTAAIVFGVIPSETRNLRLREINGL